MPRIGPPLIAAAALFALVPAVVAGFADEERDWGVAPTSELRRPPYSAPTPRTIPGAKVIATAALKAMLDSGAPPLLVDVAGGETHATIAGAHWLPGAGHGGSFFDSRQARLAQDLERLTAGDTWRPLVFFCVGAQCWLSYNAALRAVALGYRRVYWYRGGIEAWRAAGFALERVRPIAPRSSAQDFARSWRLARPIR